MRWLTLPGRERPVSSAGFRRAGVADIDKWYSSDRLGLVDVRQGLGELRPAGRVDLLGMVQGSDRRLIGHEVFHRARTSAGLLFDFTGRRGRNIFGVIDVPSRQLPHPLVSSLIRLTGDAKPGFGRSSRRVCFRVRREGGHLLKMPTDPAA